MKVVQLKRDTRKTPYEFILKLHCGPNYVINRKDAFEVMIKEQGTTFWFRFWLTFCFHTGCKNIAVLLKCGWYEPICCAFIHLHKNFVQAVVADAVKFCMQSIIRPMVSMSKKGPIFKERAKEQFADEIFELVMMAFGCALCEVFFKWVQTKNDQKCCMKYWTTPPEYTQPNFRPGYLEKYLVYKWKNKLITLLGVRETQVSWIQALLDKTENFPANYPSVQKYMEENKNQIVIINSNNSSANHSGCCKFFLEKRGDTKRMCLSCMRKKLHEMKMSIRSVDESPPKKSYIGNGWESVKSRYMILKPSPNDKDFVTNVCGDFIPLITKKESKAVKNFVIGQPLRVKGKTCNSKMEMTTRKLNSKLGRGASRLILDRTIKSEFIKKDQLNENLLVNTSIPSSVESSNAPDLLERKNESILEDTVISWRSDLTFTKQTHNRNKDKIQLEIPGVHSAPMFRKCFSDEDINTPQLVVHQQDASTMTVKEAETSIDLYDTLPKMTATEEDMETEANEIKKILIDEISQTVENEDSKESLIVPIPFQESIFFELSDDSPTDLNVENYQDSFVLQEHLTHEDIDNKQIYCPCSFFLN